ncbi:YceI family protein [Chitinilyticum piscinae]|uniref:YceI family protein n=1 Tax=Chitinilyticum piscinae TaxID=2866724 RepID=A0A8J7KD62_9NEIS|nr:YceI family protein [Chitinilyticum piscinae]MBE9608469.1 YceI family protein [Chitinilyticum piscinae]
MIKPLVLATLLLGAAGTSAAAQTLAPGKSSLEFTFSQMGGKVDGNFKGYTGKINFDPAKPEKAQAQLEVDLNTIDVGGADGNAEAKKKAWFNVAAFPKATFTATSVKALGSGKFDVKGKLTIKGISRDVGGPLTATQSGDQLELKGSVAVKRLAFQLGEGAWADTDTVGDDVTIRYKLVLIGKAD